MTLGHHVPVVCLTLFKLEQHATTNLCQVPVTDTPDLTKTSPRELPGVDNSIKRYTRAVLNTRKTKQTTTTTTTKQLKQSDRISRVNLEIQ